MKNIISVFIFTTCTLLTSASAADQTRFSIGAGITSAGNVNGGFVLAPKFAYSVRLSDEWEIAMSTRILITGIVYKNPGFVMHNVPAIGFTWKDGYVSAGPSVDVFDTILCGENDFCNRTIGVSPGATLGAAYFTEAVNSRLGMHLDAHLSVLPEGAIYSGPIWTVTLGPELRLGMLSR